MSDQIAESLAERARDRLRVAGCDDPQRVVGYMTVGSWAGQASREVLAWFDLPGGRKGCIHEPTDVCGECVEADSRLSDSADREHWELAYSDAYVGTGLTLLESHANRGGSK